MRLVHGQMGIVLADYSDRSDESDHQFRFGRRQACVRGNDADEENRRRCHRGRTRRRVYINEVSIFQYRSAGARSRADFLALSRDAHASW